MQFHGLVCSVVLSVYTLNGWIHYSTWTSGIILYVIPHLFLWEHAPHQCRPAFSIYESEHLLTWTMHKFLCFTLLFRMTFNLPAIFDIKDLLKQPWNDVKSSSLGQKTQKKTMGSWIQSIWLYWLHSDTFIHLSIYPLYI